MDEYFKGRKARHPNETEVAMNAAMLERLAGEMGEFCVKRDYGDYGVAGRSTEEGHAVQIILRGDRGGTEHFATWRDAAAAGWQVD